MYIKSTAAVVDEMEYVDIICDYPNANITKDIYKQLIEVTDKLEVTLSGYLRHLVEKELRENQKKEDYINE